VLWPPARSKGKAGRNGKKSTSGELNYNVVSAASCNGEASPEEEGEGTISGGEYRRTREYRGQQVSTTTKEGAKKEQSSKNVPIGTDVLIIIEMGLRKVGRKE